MKFYKKKKYNITNNGKKIENYNEEKQIVKLETLMINDEEEI